MVLNNNLIFQLVDLLPVSIFWKDTKGVYLGCNTQFTKALGFNSIDEILGKTDDDLATNDLSDHYRRDDQEVILSGIPKLNIEEEQNFPDGRKLTILTSKAPIFDKNNEIIGVLGIYNDITALKNAKKKAEAANKAKAEFIMNMSHDLRTPLSGIIGLSNIQSKEGTTTQDKKYGQWIQGAGQQLLELLNSVVELTAAEHPSKLIKKDKLNLIQLAEELRTLMQPSVLSKGLKFQLKLDDFPIVISDRIKLKRILLNLLSNAVKFSKQGEVGLKMELLYVSNNRAHIEIHITDTGIGIAPSKLNKIFDRFYRIHPSYKAEYTGYGLGLYLVKKATESLGGKITVSSEEGKGSCFSLEFNFAIAEQDSNRASTYSEPFLVSHKISDSKKGSVLIAEDNSLVLYVVKKMLVGLGYQVFTATTGVVALQVLQTQSFDWGLLDLGLPDLDGIETLKRYREWEQSNCKPCLPIFALTAYGENKVKDQCKEAGFDQVFHKPFTEKEIQIIEKYLK